MLQGGGKGALSGYRLTDRPLKAVGADRAEQVMAKERYLALIAFAAQPLQAPPRAQPGPQ